MRWIANIVVVVLIASGCSSSQPTDQQGSDGEATAFAQRLYGSVWTVAHARPAAEHASPFDPAALGSISFYGSLGQPAVSVNHDCGSATAEAEITDNRVFTIDFAVPPGCEEVAVFMLFAEPEIEAAFRGQNLELTTAIASLSASHFISVSDDGTAPLLIPSEHDFIAYIEWELADTDDNDPTSVSIVVPGIGPLCNHGATIDPPEIVYSPDEIRIAIPIRVKPVDLVAEIERLREEAGDDINKQIANAQAVNIAGIHCRPSEIISVQLDQPSNGRAIVPWIRATTRAR